CGKHLGTARLPYFRGSAPVSPKPLPGRGLQKTELLRLPHRLEARSAAELGEDVADVHVDSPGAEEQLAPDLPIGPAQLEETDHLQLSPGESTSLQVCDSPPAEPLHLLS